jgi:hypothetical protein
LDHLNEIKEVPEVTVQRRPSQKESRLERAKAERAAFIVSKAVANKTLMQETLASFGESERGEGVSWEEFCRQEASRRQDEV